MACDCCSLFRWLRGARPWAISARLWCFYNVINPDAPARFQELAGLVTVLFSMTLVRVCTIIVSLNKLPPRQAGRRPCPADY